jgi:hypothetical protein
MPKLISTALASCLAAFFLAACGGGGGTDATPAMMLPAPTPSTLANNVLAVTVDQGPQGSAGRNVNRLYADVTVCQAGNSGLCQTIDHVLVDTGSTGLRLLASALSPSLSLAPVMAASGLAELACGRFIDNSFIWGPVALADVTLGGKTAQSTPVHIVGDPAYKSLAGSCSTGTSLDTVAALGAKGILGVSLFKEDCGTACVNATGNGTYFTCATAGCTSVVGTRAELVKQVKNPIPLFATDNNGFLLDLPGVGATGLNSLSGSMIFGIGTQSNNQFVSEKVLTTSPTGFFTTVFSGQSLTNSFLDTGSNGIYFDLSSIPKCSGSTGANFYCPPSTTTLQATQVGANAVSNAVTFSVDNAGQLFSDPAKTVLPTLAGGIGSASRFDWGLPFYYGRRVFTGIEGQATAQGPGPFHAF